MRNAKHNDKFYPDYILEFRTWEKITYLGAVTLPLLENLVSRYNCGSWGAKALAEKILDPNRNISEAFRTYTIRTKDGKISSGLFRREVGQVIIFADAAGNEFAIEKDQIEEQKTSRFTLMPDHFGTVLSQEDFNSLLSFLLEEK